MGAAIAALVLAWRTQDKSADADAGPDVSGEAGSAEAHSGVSGKAGPGRELLSAWVQFLRSEIAEAANAMHNRLNVIAAAAEMDQGNLSEPQRHALSQIKVEVTRAAKISRGLMRRVTSMAPDSVPPALYEYEGEPMERARILVVEDDEANRSVMTRLFQSLGHDVIPVSDGRDAFQVLERDSVDCIISDIRLPYMGGRTLFEQVEEQLPQLTRKFIFVTGDYTRPESREFLERTGQPLIGKPYELNSLLGAVAETLKRRHVAGDN
ncbi:MAG: response regulator [Gemmatimonadales bacterium]